MWYMVFQTPDSTVNTWHKSVNLGKLANDQIISNNSCSYCSSRKLTVYLSWFHCHFEVSQLSAQSIACWMPARIQFDIYQLMEWLKFLTDNLVRHGANMLIHMWRAYLHHIHTIAIFRTVLTARNGECYATSHDVFPSWVADWMMDDGSGRIPKSSPFGSPGSLGPALQQWALKHLAMPCGHGDPIDSDSGVTNSPIRIVTFAT